MDVKQRLWTIRKLLTQRDQIDLNPAWQRGPARPQSRRVLLIDSILRRMDLPKIYLRRTRRGSFYRYEAVDGQQRLRAIWDFASGDLVLTSNEPLDPADGHPIQNKRLEGLHVNLKKRFDDFKISVAEIVESTNDEVTNLFARLQMGVPLNPAELRHASLGPMRHMIHLLTVFQSILSELQDCFQPF
jgi:hypothetical protein